MHRSYLIKPASSLCNMNCKYCFYSDIAEKREVSSYGMMNKETMENLINQSLALSSEITYAFQGGEPTVIGLDYFKSFVEYVNLKKHNQKINYTLQTNGVLLNDEWLIFLKENHFLVGLSIDGYQENHDLVRMIGKQKSFKKIMKTLKKIQEYNIEYNVLTVLTESLAKNPKKLLHFYLENNIKYVQLTPCLPKLGNKHDVYSLKPNSFFIFYNRFYKLWKEEYMKGNYISISLFDQLFSIFQGRYPSMCGMLGQCQIQYVIEANGNVYPCDFYCTDEYLMGNVLETSLKNLDDLNFVNRKKRTCSLCKKCRFGKICNGNCPRLNVAYFNENYCGYQEFLENNYKDLYITANQ